MLLQVLPEGFGLPPVPYLAGLGLGLLAVGYGFATRDPPVTARHVLGLMPWMLVGATAHVLHVIDTVPPVIDPLFGTPAVYLSTATVAGAIWLAALERGGSPADWLGAVGMATLVPALAAAFLVGIERGAVAPTLPGIALLVGAGLGMAAGVAMFRLYPPSRETGGAGLATVVAHGIDGVTTAVGVDLLGFGERSPVSRAILEFAAGLPTATTFGSGWLFVLVKLLIAAGAVAAMTGYVREDPREGYLLLALIAAVGLGPGFHNAVLFAVTGA